MISNDRRLLRISATFFVAALQLIRLDAGPIIDTAFESGDLPGSCQLGNPAPAHAEVSRNFRLGHIQGFYLITLHVISSYKVGSLAFDETGGPVCPGLLPLLDDQAEDHLEVVSSIL